VRAPHPSLAPGLPGGRGPLSFLRKGAPQGLTRPGDLLSLQGGQRIQGGALTGATGVRPVASRPVVSQVYTHHHIYPSSWPFYPYKEDNGCKVGPCPSSPGFMLISYNPCSWGNVALCKSQWQYNGRAYCTLVSLSYHVPLFPSAYVRLWQIHSVNSTGPFEYQLLYSRLPPTSPPCSPVVVFVADSFSKQHGPV